MILDYSYSDKLHRLDLSYIEDNGSKKILQFNINRFKTFYKTPTGKYTSWDDAHCDIRWTEKPSPFDIKYYFREMDEKYRNLISKRTFPKVYTFDIETYIPGDNEFPKPEEGKYPITTISVVSPELNCIVLATRELSESEKEQVNGNFHNYLNNTKYFKELKLSNTPSFKYIKFDTEEEMLRFFLKNIVSKTPILSGWNCIFFDWYYITTRIQNYFPNISLNIASCTGKIERKRYMNERGDKIYLPMPEHTLIIDMMQVIKDEDYVVMPIKESYGLDYIAYESMGINKIEYDGTLQDLYNKDYPRYVYYNAIDSILVQLINYRFKTLDHIYMYSLYCMEKIGRCFSKIAVTEALVFQDFYNLGLKIPYEPREIADRGRLLGAYVKIPIPGLHEYVCCNDFASLYPSTIRTCNLSFENYIGAFWDDIKLNQYTGSKYIIIGPNVYTNGGTPSKPSLGKFVGKFLNEEKLNKYRNDKNYFVSVNGCVYKNDKDYAFRRIQGQLKANRDESKYLGKQLDATVMVDLTHIIENKPVKHRDYNEQLQKAIAKIGLNIQNSDQLAKYNKEELNEFIRLLKDEIIYYSCHEQAMKLLMNSMYGGSSHQSFYWFNMNLANDITGESRNLIHMMEHHIPDWFRNNWINNKELHNQLGVEVDTKQAETALDEANVVTESQDPDAYHKKSFVEVVYGDTDSVDRQSIVNISSSNNLIRSVKIEDWFDENDRGNKMITQNGSELIKTNDKILNWTKDNGLCYMNVNYIMRHKVTKPKWKLKTKTGEEVIVTNDHSLVVFRNGEMLEVKPYQILPSDKVLKINF